ncbi:MAG: enoyl-CoA hydratase/isomerase family protein [Planctomycetes bacterium]|nr:enoyl-CoA hydratase/isomerase family protein [Planctomycetota bacterium]
MEYKHIKYQFSDGVARITLNHPPLNVLNIAMMKEINGVLEGLAKEQYLPDGKAGLKLLVFDAEGKAFCAGVDVSEHIGSTAIEMIKDFHQIFRNLIAINKPTLAVVQGAALGGGCELAIFCDFIIAAETAKFGQPEIQVGVFPPIACMLLPRIIPQAKAMELLLTGVVIGAPEALSIGLINKSVPVDKLKEEENNFTSKITNLSAVVLGYTKLAALKQQQSAFLEYLTEVENIYLNQLMKTEDAQEGLNAFLSKRKPVWKNK